LLESFKLDMIL